MTPATRILAACILSVIPSLVHAQEPDRSPARLSIVWPSSGSAVTIGNDRAGTVGTVVSSNFELKPAGQCGGNPRCGHIHMKIDPDGDGCNQPGHPYNSMNSDWGGDLVKANFGYCATPTGRHVIGVLLADDHHRPILVDGKPVTALVPVEVRR